MSRWMTACSVVFILALSVSADYVSDRKAALDLVKAGKHEAAMTAFVAMAGGEATDVQKSDALEQAVLCAINLQQYDRAQELAKQIPAPGVSRMSQMRIVIAQRNWQGVVDQFKDDDISTWPQDLLGEAYWSRGQCALYAKNVAMAEKDLLKAVEYLNGNGKALALIDLGDVYQAMKKDDMALAAYCKAKGNGNIYKDCQAAILVAGILVRQDKLGDALKELDTIDQKQLEPSYWRDSLLMAYGNILAKQGKKTEAAAKYNEALKNKAIHPAIKDACDKALAALNSPAN